MASRETGAYKKWRSIAHPEAWRLDLDFSDRNRWIAMQHLEHRRTYQEIAEELSISKGRAKQVTVRFLLLYERAARPAELIAPLCESMLSPRAYNCLERAGFETLNELAFVSEERLRAIKHLGPGTIAEIKNELDQAGLPAIGSRL